MKFSEVLFPKRFWVFEGFLAMDFSHSEERAMLRDSLRRFLAERYEHDARRRTIAAGDPYDARVLSELAELGILGAMFSEDHNGYGGAGFDVSVVFEELGRAGVIEPVLASTILAGAPLAIFGSKTQQALIDQIISGSVVAALAHSEPNARYDLYHVETTAKVCGDTITLTGKKHHVLNGGQADTLIVSAREYRTQNVADGISLFVVPSSADGITCTNHRNIDGTMGARITFTDVTVSGCCRLGAAGQAAGALEQTWARAILAVSAEAVGAMDASIKLTARYLKDRKQFGVSIGSFQALQHRLADLLIEIEQARSAVINLAGHMDAPREVRERHTSATKNLIGRVGELVAEECIQMHGGIGMTDEYALSHFARRLITIDHQFGDSDYHLHRFIGLSEA